MAIIAGAGRFPFYVAQEAKRQGAAVVAIGIQGWVDPALKQETAAYDELPVGQLGALIQRLKAHGVRQAIMAGKVTKEVLFDSRTTFDAEAAGVLQGLRDYSVPSVLGAIAARLEREGIALLDSSTFLKAHLCPVGVLTSRGPTPDETEDIRIGTEAARTLATLDIGQTVVVKQRVIVAVEALEGTDATIRRAHTLAGEGLTVVKTAAADQDRRFDLPVIGMETLTTMAQAHVACLAVESGSTLLLERDRLIAAANAAGMCLLGVAFSPQISTRS